MSPKIEKFLLQVVKSGTAVILFLPLLVYRPVFYPYVFSKIIVFQIVVEVIFATWLFLAIYGGKKYRPNWKNPLVATLTLFVVALILISLTGVDIVRSFWSTQERMTGVLTIIHFYIWFLVLASSFREWKDWRNLIWISLLGSFLVCLYSLGQKLELEFLLPGEKMARGYWIIRPSGPLGNSIFFAVYTALHFFLAIFLCLKENKSTRKILVIIIFALFNLVMALLAASRGVILALGTAIFFFFCSWAFYDFEQTKTCFAKIRKRGARLALILLIIVIIGVVVFLPTQRDRGWMKTAPNFVYRLAYLMSGIKERTIAWRAGWQGFKERPIFGWGWENYNVIFNQKYQPFYLRGGEESTWFDRSHNQVIDMLSLTGIIGTLFYLSVFSVLFWLLFKKMKVADNLKQKTSLVIIGLMFVAYFIQNLFVFDTPAPLIIFYFSLALVCFITQTPIRQSADQSPGAQSPSIHFPLPILISLIIIFLPWAMYKFNFEPFQQSRLGLRAFYTSEVDLKSGLYWYQKALAKPVFTNPEVRIYLAKTIAGEYQKIDLKTSKVDLGLVAQGTEFAIAEYKKSVQEHPLDARHWLYLGQLYNLGVRYNKGYVQEAERALNRALELSPQRQQIYFELARTHLYLEEYKQAIEFLKQAVMLDPEVEESRQNLEKVLEAIEKENPEVVIEARQFLQELKNRDL